MTVAEFSGTAFCERVSEVRPVPFNQPALCPATDNAGEGRGADHLPATHEAVPKNSVGGRRPKPGDFCRAKVAEGGQPPALPVFGRSLAPRKRAHSRNDGASATLATACEPRSSCRTLDVDGRIVAFAHVPDCDCDHAFCIGHGAARSEAPLLEKQG